MTAEVLNEKLAGLRKQLDQLNAQALMVAGAIQFVEQSLGELTKVSEGADSGSVPPQSTGE